MGIKSTIRANWKKWALYLFFGYLFLLMLTYLNQNKLLYHPEGDLKTPKAYGLPNTQEIFLETKDNLKLQTWVHTAQPGKPYVIFYHGNAHNLPNRKEKFKALIDMGYGFIAPAWRGFGKSEGNPSKEGLYTDARTALDYLKKLKVEEKNTILVGESLGSNMAIQMAVENPHTFKGVFLISPFTSVADRGQQIYWFLPVKLLLKDNFDNFSNINKIQTPLLIVHGNKDKVTPHTHSEKLIKEAVESKKLIIYPDKGHGNLDSKAIFQEMEDYFKKF